MRKQRTPLRGVNNRNHPLCLTTDWYSLGVFYWSSSLISLLEMTIYSVIISTLLYFISNQHGADNYTLNWTRLGYYNLLMWILAMYCHAIGNLVGTLFVDHPELAVISTLLIHLQTAMLNGLVIDIDHSDNLPLIHASDMIAFKFISKLIVFTFYSLDRCDPETEISGGMLTFSVEEAKIPEYIARVVVNTLVMRACVLLVLFVKFNTFTWWMKRPDQKERSVSVDSGCDSNSLEFELELKHDDQPELDCDLGM